MNHDQFLPMHRLSPAVLEAYSVNDCMAKWLDVNRRTEDAGLGCQKWLEETPAKRYAAHTLYGDLLQREGLNILDVGGGLTSLTRELAMRHNLTVVDLMAHDAAITMKAFQASCPPFELVCEDWHTGLPECRFDVAVAADIFPNVDQRLALFCERLLPITRELRLSVTYYNEPRYYLTRRMNADEVLCMLAWDGEQTSRTLERFEDRIHHPDFSIFSAKAGSVYPNRRQVGLLRVSGDLMA